MTQPDRFWFLFTGYTVIWVLLALFLVHLGRRHQALQRTVDELRRRIGGGSR